MIFLFILMKFPQGLFGSQGQQRSVALALKLAESKVMESITGDKPVMFLDDVME